MNVHLTQKKSLRKDAKTNEISPTNPFTGGPRYISVDLITPSRFQPRKAFDPASLLRLADSIRRYGVLQPITVRISQGSDGDAESYEIVCGERRYRASIIAGLSSVPCIIINSGDMNSAELSVIENLLRDDLNMFEQAESFSLLIKTFSLTQDDVANRVSLSQSAVANKLRLLKFTSDERSQILRAGLTERHARTLLRLPDTPTRMRFIKIIDRDKLNVASTETLVENFLKYLTDHPNKNDEPTQSFSQTSRQSTGIVKDIRILTNTIEKAAGTLRKSGILVETKVEETHAAYNINISVYKRVAN